ncbi:MAG TPA: carboxypeptidase regulatory-like domain-containing protein [Acidobacteriaceae bacterium]
MPNSGFSRHFLLSASLLLTGCVGCLHPSAIFAQSTSGDVVGTVSDPTGAAVPHATVTATNEATAVVTTVNANENGEFRLSNLPAGHYTLKGSAPGFQTFSLQGFPVTLNQTATASLRLPVASTATNVEVSAQAQTAIDTTTIQLQQTFTTKETQDLPMATIGLGALNLSLLSPGVATSGGIGAGTGPAVGGQRPRNNNFTVEGIDDNDKSVTGPLITVPNDATGEFTLLTNQFSPEFGHSTGGQFNTTILSGTNQIHGRAYEYFQNRNLNAIDASTARGQDPAHIVNPRFDQNRFGGQVGGPILKDKLFYFSNFEKYQLGQNLAYALCTPTAAGYAAIDAIPGVSSTNLSILKKYVPASASSANAEAACGSSSITVSGKDVPVGALPFSAAYFTNDYQTTNSIDYTPSQNNQFRFRYMYLRDSTTDTSANLGAFWLPVPNRYHLFAGTWFHEFSPNLTNEFRLGYNRYSNIYSAGNFSFPGLDSFPNLSFDDMGFIQVGPDPNAPQSAIQNLYQLVDNITWVKGNHTLKFGFDGRKSISPQSFTQRVRGDYEYAALDDYLHDLSPTTFGERSTGNFFYYGDQTAFYGYANDIWRVTPHLSLNYGLRYEFTSVPYGMREQRLNIAASVPGLITFHAPQPQDTNFAPRVGFAFAPGNGDTSIRGGFGLGYDVIYDNLGLLTFPPQFSSTQDVNSAHPTPNFLAGGGLPPGTGALQTFPTIAAQRQATSAFMPDQKLPYSEQWNLSVQRVFLKDYTATISYVGTRGLHMPMQIQLNRKPITTSTNHLPLFAGSPDPGSLSGLESLAEFAPTSAGGQSYRSYVSQYADAGFGPAGADDANTYSNITSYQPFGQSIYHGGSVQITRRMQHGLQLNAAYTFSKTMDNSTADVFSTVLTPRRPQDFQNVAADYSRSALDHTHRISVEFIWDIPYFRSDNHWLLRNALGNWEIAPVYIYQTPEYADVQSTADANLNGDSAPDRVILNPSGVKGTGSGLVKVYDPSRIPLCGLDDNGDPIKKCTANLVGYYADNPNAQYIQGDKGLYANAGRNTLPIRPINNWDVTAIKRVNFTERYAFEFQAQVRNVFNHSQYISGYLSQINSFGDTGALNFVNPSNSQFNQPQLVFPNNARQMQLTAKFIF